MWVPIAILVVMLVVGIGSILHDRRRDRRAERFAAYRDKIIQMDAWAEQIETALTTPAQPAPLDSWAAVGLESTDAMIRRISTELNEEYLRIIERQDRVPSPDNRETIITTFPGTGIRVRSHGALK